MSSIYIIISRNNKKGNFDNLHEISENITLVKSMDTVGNVNHTVSIVGYLKFDSNYKKGLFLKLKPSNII